MKLYDENGKYVGRLNDADLKDDEDSIMPHNILVTGVKPVNLSNGHVLLLVGSMIGLLASILFFFEQKNVLPASLRPYAESLGMLRLQDYSVAYPPLTALLAVLAFLVLIRESRAFCVPAVLQLVSIWFLLFPYEDMLYLASVFDLFTWAAFWFWSLYRRKDFKKTLTPFAWFVFGWFELLFRLNLDPTGYLAFIAYCFESIFWINYFRRYINRGEVKDEAF